MFLSDLKFDDIHDIFKSGVCVDHCPRTTKEIVNCIPAGNVKKCTDFKPYPSVSVLNYCFPNLKDPDFPTGNYPGWAKALQQFKSSQPGSSFVDLYYSETAICVSFIMGVVYCFVFIFLMSEYAYYLSYFIITLVQVGMIATTVGFWFMRKAGQEDHSM